MENKKYQLALIQQAKLQNTFYHYSNLQPCAYFFNELVKGKETPSIFVPDTLLINDKESPLIWIYTNTKGKLEKSTNINLKDFINKITNYCSPNQLVAILKRVTYNHHYINGNDIKLLNSRYLQNVSFQQLGGQSQTLVTLQRYIKSNGNNPFICRTIWRKQKHSQCFIITNKKSYYDLNQPQAKKFVVKISEPRKGESTPSRIVKSIQGKHLVETSQYLVSIIDFMKLYRGVNFSQMVGDFIKDEAGNWWLVNIKAFQVQNKLINNPRVSSMLENDHEALDVNQTSPCCQVYERQSYQKTKICRYCQKSYLQSELNHYMTIRMLIETDRYLLHLGKNYKWLRRSDIQNVDTHCLYQQHKICSRCYRLYMEIQQLMDLQNSFLNILGFQMQKTPKELLMSLTNEQELKSQAKNKELLALASCFQNNSQFNIKQTEQIEKKGSQARGFPKIIELGPNSNIVFDQNVPMKNDQMINKMIRYRMILYLKELDQVQFPEFLKDQYQIYHFFLEYELFGVKNKIKLDFNANFIQEKKLLSIKKLKINYFFSHSHQDVHQYLNSQDEGFSIKIYAELRNSKCKVQFNGKTKKLSIKKKSIEGQSSSEIQRTLEKNINYKVKNSNKVETPKRILLGKLHLSIKQFFNNMISSNVNKIGKKDFYKFFSVKQVAHGWGLQGSIGVIPSQSYVNTSRMIFFTQDNLIYLPNDNYYYCEHLPDEWIDIIKKELSGQTNNQFLSNSICDNSYPAGATNQCFCEQVSDDSKSLLKQRNAFSVVRQTQNNIEVSDHQDQISGISKLKKPSYQQNILSNAKNSLTQCISQSETIQNLNQSQTKTLWKMNLLNQEIFKYEKVIKNMNDRTKNGKKQQSRKIYY